ncbi:hypothetical protein [Acidianus sp. HS-5]|uniref:hypothetical protein n=1 Tax=Acidianus sp. HS-5 TaxID=2886040 RepID=UPI001F3FAB99|nr:hypothetical protein [Acidianus sp. HS-5]BDC17118.1 hypothetical protein HS5_00080 [Acidianus sp. HS-5]
MIYAFAYMGDQFYAFWLGIKIGTITSEELTYKGISQIYIGKKLGNTLSPRQVNEIIRSWYEVFRSGKIAKYPSEWLLSIVNELESENKIEKVTFKEIEKEIKSEDEKKALTLLGDEIVKEINKETKEELFTKIAFTDRVQAFILKQPYILKPYIFTDNI